jgi:hypothetical protein
VGRDTWWEGDSKKDHNKKKSDKGARRDTGVGEGKTIPYANNK